MSPSDYLEGHGDTRNMPSNSISDQALLLRAELVPISCCGFASRDEAEAGAALFHSFLPSICIFTFICAPHETHS